MISFDESHEGRELVSPNSHRLEYETYNFLSRWVVRDIQEGRLDTQARLQSRWLNKLAEWRKSAKRNMVLDLFLIFSLLIMAVIHIIALGELPVLLSVLFILQIIVILLDYRYQSNKIVTINNVMTYSNQVMEVASNPEECELAIEAGSKVRSQELDEYLRHHENTGFYSCQLRGIKEYAQKWLYCKGQVN